mgnify:CR=1 FL=1
MITKLQNPLVNYENKWVALTKDGKKVVASATDVKVLSEKLKRLKAKDIIMTRVFPFDGNYSP